ncbi:MAG TPA: delta-60 repeat domain-containing protein, partial [Pseudomonadales bacterium]|nr:delta-60 repeat domain-containing protein [Pseudomonadales bacterium]
GTAINRIARLNSDGSLDTGFSPSSPNIYSLAVQSNGRILIGGAFSAVNGVARYNIARLNSNGSLDTGFSSGYGANAQVNALAIQPDNKIVLVGSFSSINSVPRRGIARLNVDGSLDTSFDSSSINVTGNALAVQADGKLVLGGPSTANYIVRYHSGDADADGVEDATDTNDTPDIDGDGVPNSQDAFRNNAAAAADANYDGLPDYWLEPNPYGCSPAATACNGLILDSNPPPMPLNGNYKGSTVNERVNL